jgi:hypothetical protein
MAALIERPPVAPVANPVAELAPPLPVRKPALADTSPTADLANLSVNNRAIEGATPKLKPKRTVAKVPAQPSNVGEGSSAAEVLAGGL